jgi:hypothetical protein
MDCNMYANGVLQLQEEGGEVCVHILALVLTTPTETIDDMPYSPATKKRDEQLHQIHTFYSTLVRPPLSGREL